ncbi:reverse transcriptase domain-containing protein [Geothrix sp. SG200]|uniref:reverse transcriptase domain-containing protein n=1 Tax=Geothrix sp. SG200 TaxID=2922865 RepID=UPI001FAD9CEE|nr:reverse transcriptase domain-containing protein [Geothrix sp. SG200]
MTKLAMNTMSVTRRGRGRSRASFENTTTENIITMEDLQQAVHRINREAKPGIDGVTAKDYLKDANQNLRRVFRDIHSGHWRPRPVRKAPIYKGPGEKRILGIPCIEDKVVQWAMVFHLEPWMEGIFLPCSFGFRPHVGTIDACKRIRDNLATWQGAWIIDADIRKFFDSIPHGVLMSILKRMGLSKFYRRLIFQFLKAGTQDGRQWEATTKGTPQGGVISPLLANVVLHVALDTWFYETVLPGLTGRADLIRYADDYVAMFEDEAEARTFLQAVTARLNEFGLDIHPEKTRIVNCHGTSTDMPSSDMATAEPTALNFLGFTLSMAPGQDSSSIQVTTSPISISRSVGKWRRYMEKWQFLSDQWQAHPDRRGELEEPLDANGLLDKIQKSVGGFLAYQSHLSDLDGHLHYLEAVRPVLEALMRRAQATNTHLTRLKMMLSPGNIQTLIDEARQRGRYFKSLSGDWRTYLHGYQVVRPGMGEAV